MASTDLTQYVKYIPEYQVLVCIQHGQCMNPGSGIKNHLKEYHQAIPIEMRKKIIEFGDSISLRAPDKIPTPVWDGKPIDGLKVIENGFRCIFEDCEGFVTTSPEGMKRHCRDTHNWDPKKGIKWKTQAVQTFFAGIVLRLSLIIQVTIRTIFRLHYSLLKTLLYCNP